MRSFVLFTLVITLASCGNEGERVYSVDELIADQALLSKIIAKCRINPGELRATPNCMNAAAADWKARLERMGNAVGG